MENYQTKLSEENRILEFIIDPEDAYLDLEVVGAGHDSQNNDTRLFALVKIIYIKANSPIETILEFNNQESFSFDQFKKETPLIEDAEFEKVIIELLEASTLKGFEIKMNVIKGKKPISMLSPLEEFDTFFRTRINSKILLSAPFGTGKSTFLDFYFNQLNHEKYNVFTLYPVNYSVATNEDIFTYIKADILLQLLSKDLKFDEQSIDFMQATEEFVYLKPKNAILSFLDTISLLNPKIEILNKALKNLNKLVEEIKTYQASQKVDDKENAIGYIKEIYDKEGSLFEDNFFTQLIRQLLEQLKNKFKLPNVLIIEDLDRMDPDHIFRILNVISAHYDTFKFSDGTVALNKFGFDKVIIVGDISNVENIFQHKYGPKTDFRGYINKFFSSKPFHYNNQQQISFFIESNFSHLSASKTNRSPINDRLILLLNLLNENDLISLREIVKLNKDEFIKIQTYNIQPNTLLRYGPYTKAILFLKSQFGHQWVLDKIESLKSKVVFQNLRMTEDAKILLASIGMDNNREFISTFRLSCYKFKYNEHYGFDTILSVDNIVCYDPKNMQEKPMDLTFNTLDYYDLLIENIKRLNLN
jgi:hypothetical protein